MIKLENGVGDFFFFFIPKLEVLELLNVSIIGTATNYPRRARWPPRVPQRLEFFLLSWNRERRYETAIRNAIEFDRAMLHNYPLQLSRNLYYRW